ncbi:MAG: ABC transporter ATP-binding protein [Anaerostipes sp.]|nr:ABC transporter ATP-binding protein [Anaerostipes sp.]
MKQIEISHLSFSYGQHGSKIILQDIDFQGSNNESIGLIGANGVGKSTLLKLMVGLELGYQGELKIEGTPVKKETLAEIRAKTGYVFQDSESQLFMPTVYEDVAFAPRNYGMKPEEVEKRTMKALTDTHIENLKDKHIYRLSGGEKKLVSIATILSMDPSIILLDEPSVALDPKNRRNLIHVLNELNGLKIIASHDLDFIYDTCERTILLGDGKIIKDGDTKEILTDQEMLESCGLELPLSLIRR